VTGQVIGPLRDSVKRMGLIAAVPVLFWLLALAGAHSTPAAETAASQCVACHTDAAKLRALTPPDPPPSEEGEG